MIFPSSTQFAVGGFVVLVILHGITLFHVWNLRSDFRTERRKSTRRWAAMSHTYHKNFDLVVHKLSGLNPSESSNQGGAPDGSVEFTSQHGNVHTDGDQSPDDVNQMRCIQKTYLDDCPCGEEPYTSADQPGDDFSMINDGDDGFTTLEEFITKCQDGDYADAVFVKVQCKLSATVEGYSRDFERDFGTSGDS